MPKPADFDKLTPSRKLDARLAAWQNHEGIEFATKEKKGWACFAGNFPSSYLKTGTAEQVKSHCKQLLDDLAGDGGYCMVNGAVLDEAVPENLHAYIQTVKEYKA